MEPNQPLDQEFKPFYERGRSSLERLAILGGLTFLGILLGGALGILIAKMGGYDFQDFMNNFTGQTSGDRNLVRLIAMTNHTFSFLIPAIIAAYLFYKTEWKEYLRCDSLPEAKYLWLGALMIVVAFPFAQFTYWLNSMVPLPDFIMKMENDTAGLIKGLLIMDSPFELAFNLLVVALIPAVAEEMIFRGIVQSTFENIFKNPHYAVWAAAVVFSFIHMQFEGFLPRVILGLVLGYLFLWTRNLWVPILAHFVNNGAQVVLAYMMPEQMEALEPEAMGTSVAVMGIVSLVLTILVARYIIKEKDKERMVF